MKKLSLLFLSLTSTFAFSQFVSPGTGVTYNLASLSAAAPAVLLSSDTGYQMTSDITISNGDTLIMNEDTTLKIDAGKQLTIAGIYDTDASNLLITATSPANVFKGIRLESTATVTIKNTIFEYGGGIQALTGNFLMENSIVRYFKTGLVTGASLNFSTGNPIVRNSQFIENDLPAVASGTNSSVALEFSNNYLYKNTKLNSNRPQINMGPSGSNATTKILNNTIVGNRGNDKVGGISVSSILGIKNDVLIDGNIISDNRYGITITGNNCTGTISNNILTDNNVESNPNNGGSGINLYGNGFFKVEKNKIRGSLWGITFQVTASADLGGGTLGSVGENVFRDNGNNGNIYAVYNNTVNPMSAKNNCWREGVLSDETMVEEVIFHSVDDATKGTVDYTPYLCGQPMSTNDTNLLRSSIYPNPSNGNFTFEVEYAGNVVISDMNGRIIYSGITVKGKNNISLKANAGVYMLQYNAQGKKQSNKLIIK